MPLSFMTDSIVIQRAPIAIKNGMEYRDWENAVPITVPNIMVTAQSTMRDFDGRVEQTTDRRTLRAQYSADIQAGDRVLWNGETYEVEGEVFHTKSPTGKVSSTRCSLVRWKG